MNIRSSAENDTHQPMASKIKNNMSNGPQIPISFKQNIFLVNGVFYNIQTHSSLDYPNFKFFNPNHSVKMR